VGNPAKKGQPELVGGWKSFFLNIKYVFLGIIFSATLQLTGINAVMYFGPSIVRSAGIPNIYAANIGIGAVNFLTTGIAVALVEKLGRKKLMISGTILLTVSTFFIGISFHVFPPESQGYLVAIGLFFYLMGFEGGPGCVFWVVVNEAFPPHIRGVGNSFCNIVQWGFNLLLSTTFPIMIEELPPYVIFLHFRKHWCFLHYLLGCFLERQRRIRPRKSLGNFCFRESLTLAFSNIK